jgi:beta-mannosidase
VKTAVAVELDVPARSVARLGLPDRLLDPGDPRREVFVATCGTVRAVHPYLEDLELFYEPRAVTARAAAVERGYRVDVRATSFTRDVAVLADRLAPDAEVDEMLVTLLAGETRSFFVRTAARLDPAELTSPLVLRTANDLRHLA